MIKTPRWYFEKWLNPYVAVFKYMNYTVYVPFSRLIPHPLCEVQAKAQGITDPNAIVRYCAERSSVFGIELEHWFLHRLKEGKLATIDDELIAEAYEFPPNTNFACIRDCILYDKPRNMDECVHKCSSW